MSLVVTLISPLGKSAEAAGRARAALVAIGARILDHVPFDAPLAEDLFIEGVPQSAARAAVEAAAQDFDAIVQPADDPRCKRLLVADMDSTIIGQECIDELADFAGRKAEIAAITEAAMRGELDFEAALNARVEALSGLPAEAIGQALRTRVRLNPGARTLVATMKARGARTLLVSGGFTAFTGPVAAEASFDRTVANTLHMANGRLTGTVAKPIVDAAIKRTTLLGEREALGLAPGETLAVGDGANDIPMLEAAGLGIAFRAKPKTAAAAMAHIRHGDLTALLHAQGIPRRNWAELPAGPDDDERTTAGNHEGG
jgi:phosphoserine phosphatase